MTHYSNPGLVWKMLTHRALDGSYNDARDARICSNLEWVLAHWEHTPYMSGQSVRGVAADCIGGVFGVAADLYRIPLPARPTLPPDASMHDRESAVRTMRKLRRAFLPLMPNRRVFDGEVEPGDILVTGSRGPGHVLMVGPQRNTLWHCNNRIGFVRTGMALPEGSTLFAIYRILDKEKWA